MYILPILGFFVSMIIAIMVIKKYNASSATSVKSILSKLDEMIKKTKK